MKDISQKESQAILAKEQPDCFDGVDDMYICNMNSKELREYFSSRSTITSCHTLMRFIYSLANGHMFPSKALGDIIDDEDWAIFIGVLEYYKNAPLDPIEFKALGAWCQVEGRMPLPTSPHCEYRFELESGY